MDMKRLIVFFSFSTILFACKQSDGPDVSGINVNLQVQRFEQDFFAVDTNNLMPSLDRLYQKYPNFLGDFMANILGLPPVSDTNGQVQMAIRKFISDYRPVKDSADKVFKNLEDVQEEVIDGLKHVKYYFPNYKLPQKLTTFIGPMDAFFEGSMGGYGDVITSDALAIGLQLHLGSNFSLYKSEMGQALYPTYISRKFGPEYIPVNSIKNIIDDLFPDQSNGKHLLVQMVEKGKRMYLLDKLMPETEDTLKTGYTKKQLEGCYENEGLIWNFFLTNNLLNNNEPGVVKNYIGESPNTPEFGEGAPGNIGMFVGWQIVKKYMDKNSSVTLQTLMQTDARKIYEESKYRPK